MSPIDDPLAPPAPADDRPLLRVEGLRKRFGDHEVLKGVDFELRRGEVVVLIGPSGSGKTTVLRALNGLETPDAGILTADGGPVIDFSAPLRPSNQLNVKVRGASRWLGRAASWKR